MKLILLGANGQVGWELQRSLLPLGQLIVCDRKIADLENPDQLRTLINQHQPDIIVNAAAYTAVDKAETEIEKAELVNHHAVSVLANEALNLNATLIHYSTDYVFDGSKVTAYTEDDLTSPQSVYGKTKWMGEEAIRNSGCKHFIFRTSWVFAHRGNNFIKTILRLAKQRDTLSIVSDQYGAPSSASLIADISALCLHHIDSQPDNTLYGTYHLTPKGRISWYDFAQYIISKATEAGVELKTASHNIKPIPAKDYPLPAKRPANSELSTQKIEAAFNIQMPEWQSGVDHVLVELFEKTNI